jgi:arylsulfatase A-like enzyme
VIVADDLGHQDIGANNADCFYDTPSLDRLARSGLRFTAGYSANPVCSPTRYSLLTGKYPSRANVTNYFSGRRKARFAGADFDDRMALEEVTLAEVLRDAGYATFFAGKWHLGPTEEYWPTRQGFNVNRGGFSRGGPYGGKKYFSPYGNPRLEDGPDGEHLPDRLARETLQFITDQGESPFFAYLCFYSVHTPLMAPQALVDKYSEKSANGPAVAAEFGTDEQVFEGAAERKVRIVQNHAVYAGMVEAMDRAVGLLLDGLDELGLAENTLVVFTSDHGGLATSEGHPTSNLPYRCGKGWTYEGGLRVPLLVRWPGHTEAGSQSDVPVMSIDLFPTVLDVCDIDPPGDVDGRSIAAVLEGDTALDRDLFWHYPHYSNQGGFPSGALRSDRWKLIERYEDGSVQLFDLATDVGEQRDLALEQPQRVAAMRERLHSWYQEVDAHFLEPLEEGSELPWRPR